MAKRDERSLKRLGTVRDLFLNFNPSMVSFVLMRLTGLALVAYLFLHIWSLSAVLRGRKSFDQVMATYDSPLFHLAEYLLLLTVLVHMLNGLRIMAADFFALTRKQNALLWYGFGLLVLVAAIGLWFFLPEVWTPLFPL